MSAADDRPWEQHTPEDYRKFRAEHERAKSRPRKPRPKVERIDWTKHLRVRGDRICGDELNVLTALRVAPELAGLWRFNAFQNRTEFTRDPPWRTAPVGSEHTDADDLDLHAWLQRHDLDARGRSIIADAVERVARDRPYHPVCAYLDGLEWDGTPRLNLWLRSYLGAVGDESYLAAIGAAFLTSAVARVYQPGCKVDHVLVLEGRQGIGKSSVVRVLGDPWVTDSVPEFSGADAAMQLAGCWLVELAELAAMRRSEIEAIKAFLTRTEDHYRPPYGRRPVRVPRQSVFIGSTNESQYLRDPTGNRRFWPVRVTDVDLPELQAARDQLWAEARCHYQAGRPWHLMGEQLALAEAEQAERRMVTELEQEILDYLARTESSGTTEVTMRDVLLYACNLDTLAPDYTQRAGAIGPQAAHVLESAGWVRVGARGRGQQRRVVYRKSQGVLR